MSVGVFNTLGRRAGSRTERPSISVFNCVHPAYSLAVSVPDAFGLATTELYQVRAHYIATV